MEHVLGVLREAMAVQGAVSGKIRLGAPGAQLELFAHAGLSERFATDFARIKTSDPTPSAAAYSRRLRVFVADVVRDPGAALYSAAGPREGFSAMLSTPIFGMGGDVIGALSTHFARPPELTAWEGVVLDYCASKLARVLDARFGRR